jgi:hypothetical protein
MKNNPSMELPGKLIAVEGLDGSDTPPSCTC